MINFIFYGVSQHIYMPLRIIKIEPNYSMHMNKLNLEGLKFPIKVKDIPKFENLNNLNVHILNSQ